MSEYDAHPMLEPVNYDIDPEQASQYFSGDQLKIYNLLWNAAVATHIEGPVIRKHQLSTGLSFKTILCLKWIEMLEPGWTNYLAPDSFIEFYFNNTNFTSNTIPEFIPPYNENRLIRSEFLPDLSFSFSSDNQSSVVVKKAIEEDLDYSKLIDQMAKYKVARPSTYASRLELTIKNGLIGEDKQTLFLTSTGKSLLDKIEQLPSEEQLNKQTSYAIEDAIDQIECNQNKAGELLTHFCEKIFKQPVKLASWLDALDIKGETLEELNIKKHQVPLDSPNTNCDISEEINDGQHSSIMNILNKKNNESKIKYIEHDWDHFSFTTKLINIEFNGCLQTRSACQLDVSKERIFGEHLRDFEILIHYGFWKNIPYIDIVKSIDFSILTDRPQGAWYLEKLKIVYSDEFFFYDEYEIDLNEVRNTVEERFSEIELRDDIHLYSMWSDELEVVFLKSCPGI